MQESLAEYVIFWDDDITPSRECIAAYVQAMKQHPQVRQQPVLPLQLIKGPVVVNVHPEVQNSTAAFLLAYV